MEELEKKYICKFCGKEFDNPRKLGGHASKCKLNPNYNVNITNIILKKYYQDLHIHVIVQCVITYTI